MSLTLAHGNVHGSWLGVRTLMHGAPDAVSINEGVRAIRAIGRIRRYVVIHGEDARDLRRGAKDVVVLSHRRMNQMGQYAFWGARKSTPDKLAPERWFSAASFFHPQFGPTMVTSLHPHAAVRAQPANTDRVKQFDAQMHRLDAWLRFADHYGFYRVVMGDIQLVPGAEFHGLSPYEVFRKHNMKTRHVGIDCLAWDAKLKSKVVKLSRWKVLSEAKLHSDHRGFRAALTA